MDFKIEGPLHNQASVCIPILRMLPDWFGIEAAIVNYEHEIEHLPTFLAQANGRVFGFLSLKQHNPFSAEIFVMAVHPDSHHRGIGRALVETAEFYARKLGIALMQVKTLGPSNADVNYEKTRAFYEAMGFLPLEEFMQIWDENNPCLVMVKRI